MEQNARLEVEVEVKVNKTLTLNDLSTILVGCFEGGSNYWIYHIETENEMPENIRHYSDFVPYFDGVIVVYIEEAFDDSNTTAYRLTRESLIKGVIAHMEYRGSIDLDDWDAGDHDCVLQYALFGEVVFG